MATRSFTKMTPLLQAIVLMTIDAVKEEVGSFLLQELGGVTVNNELLQKNLEMKIGKDLKLVSTKLKQIMKDGKVTEQEAHQLYLLINQLEI